MNSVLFVCLFVLNQNNQPMNSSLTYKTLRILKRYVLYLDTHYFKVPDLCPMLFVGHLWVYASMVVYMVEIIQEDIIITILMCFSWISLLANPMIPVKYIANSFHQKVFVELEVQEHDKHFQAKSESLCARKWLKDNSKEYVWTKWFLSHYLCGIEKASYLLWIPVSLSANKPLRLSLFQPLLEYLSPGPQDVRFLVYF